MTKTIGLVCEGPRDIELLMAVIDSLFPEDHFEYRYLQPDVTLLSNNYNGWKGVLRWCRKDYIPASDSRGYLTSGIDLIIIQIDGDVSRDYNNRQSHCSCTEECDCPERNEIREGRLLFAEDCTIPVSECPLDFPCKNHSEKEPKKYVSHLHKIVDTYLGEDRPIPVVVTIPCDSTDTWVVAAFEDDETEYEVIDNPWSNVVARSKDYHGVRIKNRKKSKTVYNELIKKVKTNWSAVVARCEQARTFQKELVDAINCE